MEGQMNGIISEHIVAPGDLWVRAEGGTLRRATETEEIAILRMAPDLAVNIGWRETASGSKVN